MNGRDNPADVLTVKDRIDVKAPEYKRVIYKRLRALVEGFISRARIQRVKKRVRAGVFGKTKVHIGTNHN